MEVSQTLGSRRSTVLDDLSTPIFESVFWIWTGRNLEIHVFENPTAETSIGRKHSHHRLGDLVPSRILAGHVVDLNCRSVEALPSGTIAADRLRTHEEGIAPGT